MHISHVELGNFRKLVAVRIKFAAEKTVFVGANNSGKTSAMTALRRFLVDPHNLGMNDFSLAYWKKFNDVGDDWEVGVMDGGESSSTLDFLKFVPQLDVWLQVEDGEMHYVQKLLPTLEWRSGLLGVRLRYEPDNLSKLQKEYITAREKAVAMREKVADERKKNIEHMANIRGGATGEDDLSGLEFWPSNLVDFLSRRVRSFFKVKAYILDASKLEDPKDGLAKMQELPDDMDPIEGNPFDGLIRVDEIGAQRGLGFVTKHDDASGEVKAGRRLSTQLRSYYDKHLDWKDTPEISDIGAMEALDKANKAFNERLSDAFEKALEELQELGYPGLSDPKLKIAAKLKLQDGLNHDSAVQYEIPAVAGGAVYQLPEESNGLGYQNLVSMVFGLMSCRDAWMRLGKATMSGNSEKPIPPLHLMLVEEPEAYLHAQVQHVFIKKAYDVLRKYLRPEAPGHFRTQLIVSTHSSHVAYACDFTALRYFRRLPATELCDTPAACVINLSSVFKTENETTKFVTRYLKATHCDLLFADAAIFIEGSAERILLPYFVEHWNDFNSLRRCYITWLEVGGSHAHRFKNLVEALGLITLIITDLDAVNEKNGTKSAPALHKNLKSGNVTLRDWVPKESSIDALMALEQKNKAYPYKTEYAVRVAYQTGVTVKVGLDEMTVYANTFEDALFYQNVDLFENMKNPLGLASKFKEIAHKLKKGCDVKKEVLEAIKTGDKAKFALDLLLSQDIEDLKVPSYISEGLCWLIKQLEHKETKLAPKIGGE